MPLLNYTTSISADKTVGEIQKMLAMHGAQFCTIGYDAGGNPTGLSFVYPVHDDVPVNFSLPAHINGVLLILEADRAVPRRLCTDEQAYRVAWRIVKSWVEAQMAFIESGQAKMEQVFLPFAMLSSGQTLYQQIENSPTLLTEGIKS